MKYMKFDDFTGLVSDEIGGGNGMQPMLVAAEMGKVVLDSDLMGRAYPNVCRATSLFSSATPLTHNTIRCINLFPVHTVSPMVSGHARYPMVLVTHW